MTSDMEASAMAKGTRVRDQDKFMLRLPDGMRERIKTKADRAGMSMNEAIVWCLEQYFPAPVSIEEKISQLSTLVAMLKKGGDYHDQINSLIDEIHSTVERVTEGKIPTTPNFRRAVSEQLERWEEDQAENYGYLHDNPFEMPEPVVPPARDAGGDLDDED